MRIRIIRCPEDAHELPWVAATECSHWSMDCPRAKKKKKGHHKLKQSEPGYVVQITKPDHDYVPDPAWNEQWNIDMGKWRHWDTPGNFRYASCTCGLPWQFHNPWFEPGEYRYVGRWKPNLQGLLYIQAPPKGALVTCTTGCGFTGAT